MKKILIFMLGLLTLSTTTYAEIPDGYGANGALEDQSITLEKALHYAIQDELLSQARYESTLDKFGEIQPFTNVQIAEQKHLNMLIALVKKYNVEVPADEAKTFTNPPSTLYNAYKINTAALKDHITMYEKLSRTDSLPEDVREIMEELVHSSQQNYLTLKKELEQLDASLIVP